MGDSEGRSKASYNREYYERNKERIAARKNHRYQTDPEYREACKARKRKQNERDKVARARKRAASKPRNRQGPKKMRVEMPDGTPLRIGMFTLGQAAWRIGVSPNTVSSCASVGGSLMVA